MKTADLQTPALVVELEALEHNLSTMSAELPGGRLRPHVKAHKCTELASRQHDHGHVRFTCATIREVEGMVAAGLDDDLLLANEVLRAERLGVLVRGGSRVTLAVDSLETVEAAAVGGVREVVIDVNVGLPRCGCAPEDAGALADMARRRGLSVRGVMGYEGHLMMELDSDRQRARVEDAMTKLLAAHEAVGGDLVSAGGTGTYRVNVWANEIQAGSYALMDTHYAQHRFPFRQALFIEATVISTNMRGFAVADCGLKALAMDHGNPSVFVDAAPAHVMFCSDEHVTFGTTDGGQLPRVGDRVRVAPAHIDPTIAYHDAINLIDDEEVLERWPVDLRGW